MKIQRRKRQKKTAGRLDPPRWGPLMHERRDQCHLFHQTMTFFLVQLVQIGGQCRLPRMRTFVVVFFSLRPNGKHSRIEFGQEGHWWNDRGSSACCLSPRINGGHPRPTSLWRPSGTKIGVILTSLPLPKVATPWTQLPNLGGVASAEWPTWRVDNIGGGVKVMRMGLGSLGLRGKRSGLSYHTN